MMFKVELKNCPFCGDQACAEIDNIEKSMIERGNERT
jgi:hypothetical protein